MALAAVLATYVTFEVVTPDGAIDGDARIGPGFILALLSSTGILAGGLLLRRS